MTRFATLTLLVLLALPARAQEALGIFVGNQGAPASVTFVDPASGSETQLLSGQLGGFLQGMALIDGRLYVTGNGTRIDVLDPSTRQRVGQITDADFTTARYIAATGDGRAYVTTQTYDPSATAVDVVIVDLATNTVTGRIALPVTSEDGLVYGNPEGLAVAGGKAYVSQAAFGQGTEIAVIDTATDALLGTIDAECTARYPVADDDGDIIVPCAGGTEVVVIDTATDAIAERVAAPTGITLGTGFAQDATVAPALDIPVLTGGVSELVYILAPGTGLAVFDSDAYDFVTTLSIPEAASRSIVSLGVDPERHTLYLGRPDPNNPYSAAGTVTAHDGNGELQATYTAGVFPSFISVDLGMSTASEPLAEAGLRISAPVPNPTAGRATLAVEMARASEVIVAVYDALGREVSRERRALAAGAGEVSVDAAALPAGVYVVRIETAEGAAVRRLTVAR